MRILLSTLSICFLIVFYSCEDKNENSGKQRNNYKDGDVITLQKATKGKGIDLVFIGDGYTLKEINETDEYMELMREVTKQCFSIEPTKSLREYFNVYAVIAVSDVNKNGSNGTTKFNIEAKKKDDLPSYNTSTYEQYIAKAVGENYKNTICSLFSREVYFRSIATMEDEGNSLSVCITKEGELDSVMLMDRAPIWIHEIVGHGIGRLADEYVTVDEDLPLMAVDGLRQQQQRGDNLNIDATNNLSEILWKQYINKTGYENVGAFEGGHYYARGVWRCEDWSIMCSLNVIYFNVASREAIYKRTKTLAGEEYSFDSFLEYDKINLGYTATASSFSSIGNNQHFCGNTLFKDSNSNPK